MNKKTAHRLTARLAATAGLVALLTATLYASQAFVGGDGGGLLNKSLTGVSQVMAQANPTNNADPANNTNQRTLTAIPPRYGDDGELRLAPGERYQVSLRVRNSSDEVIYIRSLAEDFMLDEDGETPIPIPTGDEISNRWSLAGWLTVAPNFQLAEPHETVGVNVLIEVPEDALPGGHYAMVMHQPELSPLVVDGEEIRSVSAINQRVGTLLYVVVDGPIHEEAFVRDLYFPPFSEFGPVPYSFTIENASDVHIRPRIDIEIKDMFGRRVAQLQPETRNIFPLMGRDFAGEWDQIWGTGRYTATLTASYGLNGQVVIAKTNFWLFPLTLAIAVVTLLLVIIATIIVIRRHYIHRRDDERKRLKMLEEKLRQIEGDKLKSYED